jgi:hypothetical protein
MDNELRDIHDISKDRLKRFKFGLLAYREQATLPLKFKLSSSTDIKYYDAKKKNSNLIRRRVPSGSSHSLKGLSQSLPDR